MPIPVALGVVSGSVVLKTDGSSSPTHEIRILVVTAVRWGSETKATKQPHQLCLLAFRQPNMNPRIDLPAVVTPQVSFCSVQLGYVGLDWSSDVLADNPCR